MKSTVISPSLVLLMVIRGARRYTLPVAIAASSAAYAQQPIPAGVGKHDSVIVRGTVTDETGRPLHSAQISLPNSPATFADSAGRFAITYRLASVPRTLTVRHIGFVPYTLEVTGSVDTLRIALQPLAQELEPVRISATASDKRLTESGFYQRQRTARGRFLDSTNLTGYAGTGLSGILRETSRITVNRAGNQDYAFATVAGRPCRMNVFVDGRFERGTLPNGSMEGLGLAEIVAFSAIHAVEIYPNAASVPSRFTRPGLNSGQRGTPRIPPAGNIYGGQASGKSDDPMCGAIVIWTKAP